MAKGEQPSAVGVAAEAGFELLRPALAEAVEAAVSAALDAGVVFEAGPSPLRVFQAAVAESVRDIECHPMGRLVGRFLREGPLEAQGALPEERNRERLGDEETERAIGFVYSFMVNSFKGLLAELVAAYPVAAIVEELRRRGQIPATAKVLAGDLVRVRTRSRKGWAKGADFHVLHAGQDRVDLYGVAEVKSYPVGPRGLMPQLERHSKRAKEGLIVGDRTFDSTQVVARGVEPNGTVLRIEVVSESWKLPRDLEECLEGQQEPEIEVPVPDDKVEELAPGYWRVTLRWSREALAAAALGMTFWYMGKVGEVHYVTKPQEWGEMTAAEAGQNAVKMMLYYALLRAPEGSLCERQAIALYNAYGFGYALGMSFIGPGRRRRMLWPEDLGEIQQTGRTKDGGRIRGYPAQEKRSDGTVAEKNRKR